MLNDADRGRLYILCQIGFFNLTKDAFVKSPIRLGLPGELGVVRSLFTLIVTSVVVFGLAAWLFDPEHRLVRRGAAG